MANYPGPNLECNGAVAYTIAMHGITLFSNSSERYSMYHTLPMSKGGKERLSLKQDAFGESKKLI